MNHRRLWPRVVVVASILIGSATVLPPSASAVNASVTCTASDGSDNYALNTGTGVVYNSNWRVQRFDWIYNSSNSNDAKEAAKTTPDQKNNVTIEVHEQGFGLEYQYIGPDNQAYFKPYTLVPTGGVVYVGGERGGDVTYYAAFDKRNVSDPHCTAVLNLPAFDEPCNAPAIVCDQIH